MFRFKSPLWLAAGIVVLLGIAHAAPSVAAGDEAAIREQTLSWVKAFNGGDANAVASLYAEDALLLPPNAPGVKGRAAILAFFTKEIADAKAGGVVFELSGKTQVGFSGNLGWESGTYKATIKGAVVEKGKFLSVSRKKDGKWLYLRDTWNADAPSATPVPAAPTATKK